MKKALLILLALVLLAVLCACNSAPNTLASPLPYSERKAQDSSGNYALLGEYGDAVSDAVYSSISLYENFAVGYFRSEELDKTLLQILDYSGNQIGGVYEEFLEIQIEERSGDTLNSDALGGPFYEASFTAGVRTQYKDNSSGSYFAKAIEVPDTEYVIYDKFGKPVVNLLLEGYYFSPAGNIGNEGEDAYDEFVAYVDGDEFVYEVKDGVFTLREKHLAGETGVEGIGYRQTVYYYADGYAGYGINDSEGNTVLKPIYSYAEIAAADRFILYSGYSPYSKFLLYPNEYMAYITDTDGNILAAYSNIYRAELDGGEIWLAYYVGDDDYYMGSRFNSENDPLDAGYWFIDRDGKRLSPCIKEFADFTPQIEPIPTQRETLSATGENGEKLELSLKDYLLK